MKKKILIFCVVFVMLFAQIAMIISGIENSTDSESKITESLASEMNSYSDDEYIPIYVYLHDYGDTLVYSCLSQRLGTEINSENEGMYVSACIAEKQEMMRTEETEMQTTQISTSAGLQSVIDTASTKASFMREIGAVSEVMSNEEIVGMIEAGKTYNEIITVSEKNEFLSEWRSARNTVNKSISSVFADKLDTAKCRNIEIDSLLAYVKLECKKSYISTLDSMAEVKEIGKYENPIHIDASDDASTHSTTGGYLMTPHETLNYTGSGVRVGVLESYGYDSSASHLSGKTIVKKDDVTTVNYLSHGTMVTSILAGKAVTLNGTTYQGIAPNASIYYANGTNLNADKKALYWLIVTKNVSVINMSGGYEYDEEDEEEYALYGTYTDIEIYYDCLITQYRTVIVNSAGNRGENDAFVTSPGEAYNIISVGNISNVKDSNNKYVIDLSSSYITASYLPNKPDISAFGTNIKMVYNGALTNKSGTSYSAPMVTGTVALMMEANPNLIGKPDAVKAILVSSADNNAISSTSSNSSLANCYTNTSIGTLQGSCELKNKSGAGMLRIKTAVSMAENKTIMYRFAIPTSSTVTDASFTIDTFTLPTGNTYKATLVFEKATDNESTGSSVSSFKFGVYNSQNQEVISSKSSNTIDNNVQSIKVNVLTGGAYTFKITCERMEGNNITPPEIIDENGNTVSHQAHGNIYMTFILSCTCDTPGVVADEETSLIHSISCENCGYMLEEANDKMVEYTKSFTGVNVKSTAYYKLRPFNHDYTDIVIISEHTDPVLTPTSSSYVARYIREVRDTNVYSDRYTVSWTFEIIVYSSDGIVNNFITCITLNLYYDTRPAAFSYTYTQL